MGIVTPTEGGILAAIYAVILGFFVYKELTLKTLLQTLLKTTVNSASILLIIASFLVMSWVVMSSNIPNVVQQMV
ncbi:TRAP transporter large permease subunit [Marasmitruncus massiliensis]|uniref:TRAP transporter large permease subunit n=1 Tax=Marasmitruncus massiliensis TaxID=1944642 RepID=UPI000C7C6F3E